VAVIGHELAHLDRGHLLRRARQWKLAQQSLAKRDKEASPEKLFATLGLMSSLFQRPFGPEEELEADRDGITWAYRLGYDPRAVRLIYDALEAKGGGLPHVLPAFLRTHPLSPERHENLQATFAALAAAEPRPRLYLGRENLARRLTRQQQEFPE
jgi:predicted Zn-dependent protease